MRTCRSMKTWVNESAHTLRSTCSHATSMLSTRCNNKPRTCQCTPPHIRTLETALQASQLASWLGRHHTALRAGGDSRAIEVSLAGAVQVDIISIIIIAAASSASASSASSSAASSGSHVPGQRRLGLRRMCRRSTRPAARNAAQPSAAAVYETCCAQAWEECKLPGQLSG